MVIIIKERIIYICNFSHGEVSFSFLKIFILSNSINIFQDANQVRFSK